ncbi:hypothetical protein B0H13DRAFT_2300188 [Mycena leptocephala]|nr:hypothetical protein B0H13DRAFT_2300188 [Mycena leptocephala]
MVELIQTPLFSPSTRLLPIIRGYRAPRDNVLTEDDLYLDDARPTNVVLPLLRHPCTICLNAKSHPVKLVCEHSTCYVCIRVSLETQWACPECGSDITRKPVPHGVEEAEIGVANVGWDNSRVNYDWQGLVFPRRQTL